MYFQFFSGHPVFYTLSRGFSFFFTTVPGAYLFLLPPLTKSTLFFFVPPCFIIRVVEFVGKVSKNLHLLCMFCLI